MEKTALEVCEKVISFVRSDADRLDMNTWYNWACNEGDNDKEQCGTTACLSGWMASIVDGSFERSGDGEVIIDPDRKLSNVARENLVHNVFLNCPAIKKGTREYLKAALVPFEQWIDKQRSTLARIVVPINRKAEHYWL
jgi:hypothetical protein